jgi:hypothetical protein
MVNFFSKLARAVTRAITPPKEIRDALGLEDIARVEALKGAIRTLFPHTPKEKVSAAAEAAYSVIRSE